jgi:hypothetical protein
LFQREKLLRLFDLKEVIFVKFCVIRFKLFFTLHYIPLCSCIVSDLNARTTKSKERSVYTRSLFLLNEEGILLDA